MLLTSVLPGNHWHFVSSLSERRMDKKDLYWYWRDSTTHTTEVVPAVLSVSCQIFSHQKDLWVSSESSTVTKTAASISLPVLSISLYYDSSMSACTLLTHSLTNLFFNSVIPLADLQELCFLLLPLQLSWMSGIFWCLFQALDSVGPH